jgi:hypothetical protein
MEFPAPQVDSNTEEECHRKVAAKRALFIKVFVIEVFLRILFFLR